MVNFITILSFILLPPIKITQHGSGIALSIRIQSKQNPLRYNCGSFSTVS